MAQENEPGVWLKTLGIASLCQWDMLVFLHRHPSLLIGVENFPFFLGYETVEAVAALDNLDSLGLVQRSRVSQGVRLYEVAASADPASRDAVERLMTLADSRAVRLLVARSLRGSDRPDQNKNDPPLPGVRGGPYG